MPLPDDSTIDVRIWTAQECVACHAQFQYLRRYTVLRRDTQYNATLATIEADYKKHAAVTAESCPCPHCGWVQPDMIAGVKAVRHGTITFFCFLLLIISVIATGLGVLPRDLGSFVGGALVFVVLLLHLAAAFANPNRDCSRNLPNARRREEQEELRLVNAGGPCVPLRFPPRLQKIVVAAGLLVGSALALLLPVALMTWPVWVGQLPGLILFVVAGVKFANIALERKNHALPGEILEVTSTLVADEIEPEEFQKK